MFEWLLLLAAVYFPAKTRRLSVFAVMRTQDVALAAPVTMTMAASMSSASPGVASCSYYDEDLEQWEETGVVTESVVTPSSDDRQREKVDVSISCVTYHLSDFTVSSGTLATAVEPVGLVSRT